MSAQSSQLPQLIVKSTQGLMRTSPLGILYPSSRRYMHSASDSPPPAESPMTTMFSGGIDSGAASRRK